MGATAIAEGREAGRVTVPIVFSLPEEIFKAAIWSFVWFNT